MLSGLTVEQSQRVENYLSDLVVRAEAEVVFLCNKGGYILAESMVREYAHNDNIAALAAGSFFATREIARLVGEPEFRYVFHQGEHKSIFMQNTVMDLLIVVVFGDRSNPGLVKLCADETGNALDACLSEEGSAAEVENALQAAEVNFKQGGPLFKTIS